MALVSTLAGRSALTFPEIAKALSLSSASYDWALEDFGETNIADWTSTEQRWHDNFVLVCPSRIHAWQWLPLLDIMGKARAVYLLVRSDRDIEPGQGPRTVTQLRSGLAAAQAVGPVGYETIKVSAGKWVDIHRSITAALMQYTTGRPNSVLNGLRVGITDPTHARWAAGDPLAKCLPLNLLKPEDHDIFPVDVVLATAPLQVTSVRQPAGVLIPGEAAEDFSGWSTALPPVDTRCISPHGFLAHPVKGPLRAQDGPDGELVFRSTGTEPIERSIAPGEPLDERMVKSMRDYSYVDFSANVHVNSIQFSALLSGLAVAGVPVLFGTETRPPPLLGKELQAAMAVFDVEDSLLIRESKSIDMRRLALGLFEPSSRWQRWTKSMKLPRSPDESVSVVLATRRADRIEAAIRQIELQSWPSVEIVLVLHGIDVSHDDVRRIAAGCSRDLVVRRVDADKLLGEVLNIGVEAASGKLIAKMDDDDWYGKHHLADLVKARRYSCSELVGSQVEFVYLEDLDIVTRRPYEGERYADHVAGGTILLAKTDLLDLGGWRPVHRAVDRCLLQAVEAAGASIYRAHGQNYVMHRYGDAPGHGGHTWAPDQEVFLQNSVEQWSGFALPPQINRTLLSYVPQGRANTLDSVFSSEA